MRSITIKSLPELKKILEDPKWFDIYRHFLGARVIRAEVKMYEHSDGARVEGRDGRWWVYVRVYGRPDEGGMVYDIALWKLLRYREIADALKGVIERRRYEVMENE